MNDDAPAGGANQPSIQTAIVVLGNAMFFKPESEQVLSITLHDKERLSTCFDDDTTIIVPGSESLESLHIVVKSNDIDRLYDTEALSSESIGGRLKPGAQVVFHILSEGGTAFGGAETIRMSLVLGSFRLHSENEDAEGNIIIVGVKPGCIAEEDAVDTGSDDSGSLNE